MALRISLLLDSLHGGGAARVASHLTRAWADAGREVTVITIDGGGQDGPYSIHPAVKHRPLSARAESPDPLTAIVNNLPRLLWLRNAIRETRPHILISFLSINNVKCLLATRGIHRFPIIVSERTDPHARSMRPAWEWLRRRTYPWADALVTQTTHAMAYFSPAVQRKGVVIPNPVLPIPREGEAEPLASRRSIVTMGSLRDVKGHDLLIEAFARIAKDFPDWDLLIHGEGPNRAALESQARASDLQDRVLLPGATSPGHLWKHDLFVLPSRAEGFPNALAEAMASGLPVVSFDCMSGPAELIRDGIDGMLVPPGDVDAMARAMARLMSHPEVRADFAAHAPEVLERFSLQRVLDLWERLFESLLPAAACNP